METDTAVVSLLLVVQQYRPTRDNNGAKNSHELALVLACWLAQDRKSVV